MFDLDEFARLMQPLFDCLREARKVLAAFTVEFQQSPRHAQIDLEAKRRQHHAQKHIYPTSQGGYCKHERLNRTTRKHGDR